MHFHVTDFPSFQSNNFWNAISWKCFLKDDCIRSSLTECQSFLNRKIDVDPMYPVLMSLPCIVPGIAHRRGCMQINFIRIGVTFVPRIRSQKEEEILSVSCSNFDLQVPIPN